MKKIISLLLILFLAISFTSCQTARWAYAEDENDETTEVNEDEEQDAASENLTQIIRAENPEENAISADSGSLVSKDIIVIKTGDGYESKGSEYYDWYGHNAAILASGDAVITITSADITTEATYASAVFAYHGAITITSASIKTSKNNSGGIMVTGGGIITATDLDIETKGSSSAAIRSDRGGGSITANSGIYTTEGQGSPAIYSTASIKVSNAILESGIAQGVVIEGGNSVTLESVDMDAHHTKFNGKDSTYQAILIYQSNSGDASEGEAEFTMTGGSITNENGDIFCVTNTTCDINLSGVDIENEDDTGNFLRAEKQNWPEPSSSKGGNVTLIASDQTIEGNIVISSDSSLDITLKNASKFTGAFNPGSSSSSSSSSSSTTSDDSVSVAAADGGYIYLKLEKGSKVVLTANSYITSWDVEDSSDITYGNYWINVGGITHAAASSSTGGESGGSSSNGGSSSGGSSGGSSNGGGSTSTSGDKVVIGPSGAGCNVGYAGIMTLLTCVAFIMKKK